MVKTAPKLQQISPTCQEGVTSFALRFPDWPRTVGHNSKSWALKVLAANAWRGQEIKDRYKLAGLVTHPCSHGARELRLSHQLRGRDYRPSLLTPSTDFPYCPFDGPTYTAAVMLLSEVVSPRAAPPPRPAEARDSPPTRPSACGADRTNHCDDTPRRSCRRSRGPAHINRAPARYGDCRSTRSRTGAGSFARAASRRPSPTRCWR